MSAYEFGPKSGLLTPADVRISCFCVHPNTTGYSHPAMERVRGLRGATTLDADTKDQVIERTATLIKEMMSRNGVAPADLISIVFTATPDVTSEFPAAAARSIGISEVPLLCAREIDVDGAVQRCIRVLMLAYTDAEPVALRHVYLERAKPLRTDLPQ